MTRLITGLAAIALLLSACAKSSEFGTCESGVQDIAAEAGSVLCM